MVKNCTLFKDINATVDSIKKTVEFESIQCCKISFNNRIKALPDIQ